MALSVDSRTVRHAGRTLRQASSSLKGALRRARAAPSGEARQEVDVLREALEEQLATAVLLKRRAAAQGLVVTQLLVDIGEAERRVGEEVDRGSGDGKRGAIPSNFTPLFSDRNDEMPGNRWEPLPPSEGAPEARASASSKSSSASSAESRRLDLEEQEARLDADRSILQCRERLLTRLWDVEKKREALERQSQASTNTPPKQGTNKAESMGDKHNPTLPPKEEKLVNSPKRKTESWAEEAARRTRERSLSSESGDDKSALLDLASSAAAAAVAAALKKNAGRRGRGASPGRTAKTVASKGAPKATAPSSPPPTAGAATSLLELVKLLERCRPTERFDGVTRKVDFDDHLSRFQKAVNLPGLPAAWKLAEMKEWFSGLAKVHISRYLRRDDAEAAFKEAIERLKQEFGQRNTNAEDMLADAMSRGILARKDAEGINVFISKLEEVYFLAVETDRDGDFHRTSLFKMILTNNLPHLKFSWATHVEKKELRRPTFEDFLIFLSLQRKIATRASELDESIGGAAKPSAKVGALVVESNTSATRSEGPKTYAAAAASPPRARPKAPMEPKSGTLAAPGREGEEGVRKGRRQNGPPPCPLCQQNHPLDYCGQFAEMKADERLSYAREKGRCEFCLRGGHAKEKCYTRAKCYECFGDHHLMLHGAMQASASAASESAQGGKDTA